MRLLLCLKADLTYFLAGRRRLLFDFRCASGPHALPALHGFRLLQQGLAWQRPG